MLSFVWFSLAIAVGTLLALAALHLATRCFTNAGPSGVLPSGRIGAAAMILPGFWLSVFVGAPFFGGMAIVVAGERAMRVGALLGLAVTEFVCVALGGVAGTLLALLYRLVTRRSGVQ